jgi:hypothetical protein
MNARRNKLIVVTVCFVLAALFWRPRNFSSVKVSKAEFGGGVWLVV